MAIAVNIILGSPGYYQRQEIWDTRPIMGDYVVLENIGGFGVKTDGTYQVTRVVIRAGGKSVDMHVTGATGA